MKRLLALLIAVALALPLTVSAGTLSYRDIGAKQPLLPNNYLCNANSETLDPLCELKAAWSFSQYGWGGNSGEVVDSSGRSGSIRENLIPDSEDFGGAGWSASGGSTIIGTSIINDTNAGAVSGRFFTQTGVTDLNVFTAAALVPIKGSAPAHYAGMAILCLSGGTTVQSGITIDPFNKTLTNRGTSGTIIAPLATSIEEVGSNLLVSLTLRNNATGNITCRADFNPAVNNDMSGSWIVSATGVNTFEQTSFQQSSSLQSYAATTGTAITRFYNHGRAINGVVPTVADGKLWRGADFDGTDQYIDVTSTPLISLMGFTLSAWAEFTGGAQRNPIFGFRDNANVGFFADWNVDNKPRLVLGATNLRVWTPTGVTLNDGEYHHYLLCSPGTGAQTDANNAVLYIDGILQAVSSTTTTSVQTSRLNALIGRVNVEYYTGKIDEPYVWSVNQCEDDRMAKWLWNGGRGRYIE